MVAGDLRIRKNSFILGVGEILGGIQAEWETGCEMMHLRAIRITYRNRHFGIRILKTNPSL